MGRRGGYLGGSTIIKVEGGGAGRRSSGGARGRTSRGAEHERRKVLKRKKDKEVRAKIRANEKLALELSRLWLEEKGRKLFRKLSLERAGGVPEAAEGKSEGATSALGEALKAAFAKRGAQD